MKEYFMEVLDLILNAKDNKEELVREFQNKICDGDDYSDNKEINKLLAELAYDLDYYEPNEEWRKQSHSFYGEDKLNDVLLNGIKELEKLCKSINRTL